MPPLNPISHSHIVSPTPIARDLSTRLLAERDASFERTQAHSFLGKSCELGCVSARRLVADDSSGPFHHIEPAYTLQDGSMLGTSTRMPFATSNLNGLTHNTFRLSPSTSLQTKQDDFRGSTGMESAHSPTNNQFMNTTGANPLFSSDRLLLNSYSQPMSNPSLPPLSFTPVNRFKDHGHINIRENSHASFRNDKIKMEADVSADNHDMGDHEPNFDSSDVWNPQAGNNDMNLQDGLGSDGLHI